MSSPPQRRPDGSSEAGTPRRSPTNTDAIRSSPMQTDFGPDDQLQAEASQASIPSLQVPDQGTPRANSASQNNSQIPATSSPLFFRSSPANPSIDGSVHGVPISSPAPPSDGGATPRASGQTIGGRVTCYSLPVGLD